MALIVRLAGSLKATFRAVFHKLPWEGVVWCGWLRSMRVSHKGDMFGSLPQAAWGRRGRDSEGVYMGVCHEVFPRSLASLMSHRSVGSGGKWHPQRCQSVWGMT